MTGTNESLQGLEAQRDLDSELTDQGFADPLLDDVLRFGILFVFFVRDLDRYTPAMIALLGVVVLSGLSRVLSIWQYGPPDHPSGLTLIFTGLLAEIVISPIMLSWLLARFGQTTTS